VCGDNVGEQNIGYAVGEERWDGEWCYIEEFDATIANEKI
jgi:hypothetical protein